MFEPGDIVVPNLNDPLMKYFEGQEMKVLRMRSDHHFKAVVIGGYNRPVGYTSDRWRVSRWMKKETENKTLEDLM